MSNNNSSPSAEGIGQGSAYLNTPIQLPQATPAIRHADAEDADAMEDANLDRAIEEQRQEIQQVMATARDANQAQEAAVQGNIAASRALRTLSRQLLEVLHRYNPMPGFGGGPPSLPPPQPPLSSPSFSSSSDGRFSGRMAHEFEPVSHFQAEMRERANELVAIGRKHEQDTGSIGVIVEDIRINDEQIFGRLTEIGAIAKEIHGGLMFITRTTSDSREHLRYLTTSVLPRTTSGRIRLLGSITFLLAWTIFIIFLLVPLATFIYNSCASALGLYDVQATDSDWFLYASSLPNGIRDHLQRRQREYYGH